MKLRSLRYKTGLLLVLFVLPQGLMLLWMQCCCGRSGFKPCGCESTAASTEFPSQHSDITAAEEAGCDCSTRLLEAPQQPVPVPQPLGFNQAPLRVLPSSPANMSPRGAVAAVTFTGLAAPPPDDLSQYLDQPFLCVYRC